MAKRGVSGLVVSRNILCRNMMSWVFLCITAQEREVTWQLQWQGWVYSAARMTPGAKSCTAVMRLPKQCKNLQDFHVPPRRHSTSSGCLHSPAFLREQHSLAVQKNHIWAEVCDVVHTRVWIPIPLHHCHLALSLKRQKFASYRCYLSSITSVTAQLHWNRWPHGLALFWNKRLFMQSSALNRLWRTEEEKCHLQRKSLRRSSLNTLCLTSCRGQRPVDGNLLLSQEQRCFNAGALVCIFPLLITVYLKGKKTWKS